MMKKLMKWVEEKLLPVLNKITANTWFDAVAKSVMATVPLTLIGSVVTLWGVARNYVDLPDISVINTYTFGIISLFVVFLIPFNLMINKGKRNKSIVSGFASMAMFLIVCKAVTVSEGTAFNMSYFGAGGLFTAITIGLFAGFIMYQFSKFSFFGEDSVMPSFVVDWFDSLLPILTGIIIAFVVAYTFNIDVFGLIAVLFSPLMEISQSFVGFVILNFISVFFYSVGVSTWVISPITSPVMSWGIAQNAELVAAGKKAIYINHSGVKNHFTIGGAGATLPLTILCAFSKSKKYKTMGRVSMVPAIFNINEPIIFGVVAFNPILMVPMWILGLILPAITFIWLELGFATIASEVFGMWYMPPLLNVYLQTHDIRNAILALLLFVIALLVWYPFFKIAEKQEVEKEVLKEQELKK